MTANTQQWPTKTLADLGARVTSGSRGWAAFYADHGDLFVRITNLSRDRIRPDFTSSKFVKVDPSNAEAIRTRLAPGDLLVSITADIGIIGYVDETVPTPAYINQHIARVRLDPRKADSRFVAYYLSSWTPQRAFVGATDQGAKAGMNLTAVANLVTAAPPVADQARIAAALSDADEAVRSIERLVAKKQAIKQGLLQQLVTGRVRLPGFDEPWQTQMTITDLTQRFSGYWGAAPGELEVDACIIRAGDVTAQHEVASFAQRSLTRTQHSRSACRPGDVVLTTSGTIGNVALIRTKGLAASNFIRVLRPQRRILGGSLYYALQATPARTAMAVHLGVSAMPNLGAGFFTEPFLSIPSVTEQQAIVRALEDADMDILLLRARLQKARAIKSGMMQQLLTGRVRLPMEAAS